MLLGRFNVRGRYLKIFNVRVCNFTIILNKIILNKTFDISSALLPLPAAPALC